VSPHKQVLHDLAARLSAGEAAGLEALFTDDFRLHDPATPDWPSGQDGARLMIEKFAALQGLRLDVLDTVEEGDRVAVRWRVSWIDAGERRDASIVAFYRFAGGRIAEDWGVAARAPWPGG
jgi:predicted SnoaL-like aldol condensation-catalyzing enzyme